jgi:hypothetical protein
VYINRVGGMIVENDEEEVPISEELIQERVF